MYLVNLMRFPEVEDYRYWNNSNKPKKISDKEWDKRRRDWDKVRPGIGILSKHRFYIDCIYTFFTPDINDVMDHIPLLDCRVDKLSRNFITIFIIQIKTIGVLMTI